MPLQIGRDSLAPVLTGVAAIRNLPPAFQLVGIGWYFATCIVLGTLGGLWLDGQVDTKPLFTLLGILLGMTVAGWGAYRMLKNVMTPTRGGS